VELYRRIPASGEPELIHENVVAAASILDLGAGVGRIADPLVALGHRVVAVDDSEDMLSHLRSAIPVRSRIEDLNLAERFQAVILASHFVNDDDNRRILFRVVRRHLADGGVALMEWHPPEWFDSLEVGDTTPRALGEVTTWLRVHSRKPDAVEATVTYELDTDRWTQHFRTNRLPERELKTDLAACDLTFDRFLNESRTWFLTSARSWPPAQFARVVR
jgi:SAM-dependent methyltransferase